MSKDRNQVHNLLHDLKGLNRRQKIIIEFLVKEMQEGKDGGQLLMDMEETFSSLNQSWYELKKKVMEH